MELIIVLLAQMIALILLVWDKKIKIVIVSKAPEEDAESSL